MQKTNHYLSVLGIETWVERHSVNQSPLYRFRLIKADRDIGCLLLDDCHQYTNINSKAYQLMMAMMKAIHLELKEGKILPPEDVGVLKNSEFMIVMGECATVFIKSCFQSENIYFLPDPLDLLSSPLKKKEIWLKLRHFT